MVLGSLPKLVTVCMQLCYSNSSLSISAFIGPDTFPRMLLHIVCGTYINLAFEFDQPASLMEFMLMVLVGHVHTFHHSLIRYDLQKGIMEVYTGIDRISVH